MTIKKYLDHHALAGIAHVEAVLAGERPILRLRETCFHPQGGGQKADKGRIGRSIVLHVAHNGQAVDHVVDRVDDYQPGMAVPFEVDPGWRQLNAVYHTAGHLIAGLCESRFPGMRAVAGHQWPGEARVEFDAGDRAADIAMAELAGALTDALGAALPVSMVGSPYEHRSIRIGDLPAIPCGGTHVASLAEIAEIRVKDIKRRSGRIRVSYEAFPADYRP